MQGYGGFEPENDEVSKLNFRTSKNATGRTST